MYYFSSIWQGNTSGGLLDILHRVFDGLLSCVEIALLPWLGACGVHSFLTDGFLVT